MTTLYVAGPMSGLPAFNLPAFHAAAADLRAAGYLVLNPADNSGDLTGTWEEYLRAGLRQVLDADGLALLDGWERSRGAALEVHVARSLGLPCEPLGDWLAPASCAAG